MHKTFLLSSLFSTLFSLCHADTHAIQSHLYPSLTFEERDPWFTGTLLSPGAQTTPYKSWNIEPYLLLWAYTGSYSSNWGSETFPTFYAAQCNLPLWVGITPFMDAGISLDVFYQSTQNQNSTEFGDIPFEINFQLVQESPGMWHPSIKLGFSATAPTGKYDHLDPRKLWTDCVGSGSWNPTALIVVGKVVSWERGHVLSSRCAFAYTVPSQVPIHGLSLYGGSPKTHGTLKPGNTFWVDMGLEYSMTQNWVFAFDLYYQHWDKQHFKGNEGNPPPSVPTVLQLRRPAAEQVSVAPAIEYNWSSNIGLIGGIWATCAGKNSYRFINGILALNLYF